MKYYILLAVFCASCFMAVGEELTEDQLEKLQRSVKIGSVSDDTIKGDDGKKITVVKFYTYQNEDDKYNFRMRVTLELKDRSKNTYFAQIMKAQGEVDTEYTGDDNWKFQVPNGDMERPKVSAYAIEYGILHDGQFISLVEDFDDVDSADEIKERSPTRIENMMGQHSYSYRESGDDDAEILQSQWK